MVSNRRPMRSLIFRMCSLNTPSAQLNSFTPASSAAFSGIVIVSWFRMLSRSAYSVASNNSCRCDLSVYSPTDLGFYIRNNLHFLVAPWLVNSAWSGHMSKINFLWCSFNLSLLSTSSLRCLEISILSKSALQSELSSSRSRGICVNTIDTDAAIACKSLNMPVKFSRLLMKFWPLPLTLFQVSTSTNLAYLTTSSTREMNYLFSMST